MEITLVRETVYVPTFNGNKSLPDDEQIKVHYKLVSTEMRQKIMPKKAEEFEYNPRRVIGELIIKIENLSFRFEDGGKLIAITSGKRLFESDIPSVFGKLIDEIYDFLLSEVFKEIDEKK